MIKLIRNRRAHRPYLRLVLSLILSGILFNSCNQQATTTVKQTGPLYAPTVKQYTEAITESPNKAENYFQRGASLHKMHEDSLALLDYKKAISLDSSKAPYYSAIGDLLFEHKDISGSLQWLQHAIRIDPNDAKAHIKIGKVMLINKDYPKAFSELNIALRKNVYDPEIYFLKGMVYKDMHDTSNAISSFQTSLNVDPGYRDAAIQLGQIYLAQDNALGLQYLDNAFRADSTDMFPLYAKGMYFQGKGDWENAKSAYAAILEHDKANEDALFNTGFVLMQQDSSQSALSRFDKVLSMNPNSARAYFHRGLCYESLGNKESARKDYQSASQLDRNNPDIAAALKRVGK